MEIKEITGAEEPITDRLEINKSISIDELTSIFHDASSKYRQLVLKSKEAEVITASKASAYWTHLSSSGLTPRVIASARAVFRDRFSNFRSPYSNLCIGDIVIPTRVSFLLPNEDSSRLSLDWTRHIINPQAPGATNHDVRQLSSL